MIDMFWVLLLYVPGIHTIDTYVSKGHLAMLIILQEVGLVSEGGQRFRYTFFNNEASEALLIRA